MHVVVTGGAGFIGANLVRRLLDEGFAVSVVDDLSSGFEENLADLDVAFFRGSILDERLLQEAFATVDAVVHLAARPSVPRSIKAPLATHAANATGTLNVLEAARHAGGLHTIIASSSSVYGANPTLPKSESLTPAPVSPYAVSKLTAEQYALAYGACFDLPVLPFRFFNVFGPRQPAGHAYAAVIPAFIDAALRGDPLRIDGDGLQTRDFTYVGSVTAVIADALRREVTTSGPVNLAFGSRRTLMDVVQVLEEVLERDIAVDRGPPRPGDVRHSQADQSRLRELFPDARPIEFRQGLAATLEWFRTSPDFL